MPSNWLNKKTWLHDQTGLSKKQKSAREHNMSAIGRQNKAAAKKPTKGPKSGR
jgi:hypothetical protein